MRQVPGCSLFIGNAADGRNLRQLHDAGIEAVVDLAAQEPPAVLSRDMASFRLPLVDGDGNPGWLLRMAVDVVATLIGQEIPALICCSGGMSRSPAVAAAAMARVRSLSGDDALRLVTQEAAVDVSPALWRQLNSPELTTPAAGNGQSAEDSAK